MKIPFEDFKTALGSVGVLEIAKERRRQIDNKGFNEERDDQYKDNELVKAAVCYASYGNLNDNQTADEILAYEWPWDDDWWKPTDRKHNLIKAGALIAAEIDRLSRLESEDAK